MDVRTVLNNIRKHNNQRGFATLESIAMLFVLITLLSFTLGTFGTIHTGILNSISARAYLFEITDHRADINYLRSHPLPDSTGAAAHRPVGYRYVGISSEFQTDPRFQSTGRNVDFRRRDEASGSDSETTHNKIQELRLDRRVNVGVEHVWVKIAYGICLSATCGGIQ